MAHQVTITYASIIDRCKMLSAFEGGEATAGDGQSRFPDIIITRQDEPLVKSYIDQAVQQTYNKLEKIIASTSSALTDALSWTLRSDTLWPEAKSGRQLDRHIEETIVAWTMQCWLDYKHSERSKFYGEMFINYISLAEQNISASEAPKKRRTYYGL